MDLPGTYSLMAHSAEDEIARDFICKEHPDAVIIDCGATCLERTLNLALQIRKPDVICRQHIGQNTENTRNTKKKIL